MGTFGERLQREREMRGITLEEIAEATKIGTRSLRALEEQDFDKLPGGIFNKGFVRAYSKYLGIDEDQAVADYVTAVTDAQATGKLKIPEAKAILDEPETSESEPIRIPWGLLITVALIVVIGFASRSYYSKHGLAKLRRQPSPSVQPSTPAPQPPVAAADAAPAAPSTSQPNAPVTSTTPTPAPSTTPTSAPGTTQSQPSAKPKSPDAFIVKVHTKDDAWVEISADGKRVLSELLKANTDRVVKAEKEVVLVTGNAGGVEISRNDQLLPLLGLSGAKKTVTITAQDFKQ